MYSYGQVAAPVNCRTVIVPGCEITLNPSDLSIPAEALFQIRLRDIMDFSVDFSAWLTSTHGALLASVVWTIAALSPKIPIISSTVFDSSGPAVAIIAPGLLAAVGDAYYIDVTGVTLPTLISAGSATLTIPARTITRRVNILVVAG